MRIAILAVVLLVTSSALEAQTHQNVINWTASPTTGVTGYNVYKLAGTCPVSPTLGVFTKLGSTTAAVLTYTDTAVTAGGTNCYVVTAFTSGGESGYNGTWQATTPIFTASTAPLPPGGPTTGSSQ